MSVPIERVETRARFDTFFEEERERLFKALYFVTGSREDAEELTQDAFLRLWERWGKIDRIDDPTGYLFRVALNGFRMRRRRAAVAVRKLVPVTESSDAFLEAEMRADIRQLGHSHSACGRIHQEPVTHRQEGGQPWPGARRS